MIAVARTTAPTSSAARRRCWSARGWEQRNLGVKLLGLLHARDKMPLLLALLHDKRPAPLVQAAARRRLRPGRLHPPEHRDGARPPRRRDARGRGGAARRRSTTRTSRCGRRRRAPPRARGRADRRLRRGSSRACAPAATTAGSRWRRRRRRRSARWADAHDALPALLALQDAQLWRLRAAALEGLLSLVERGRGGDPARSIGALNAVRAHVHRLQARVPDQAALRPRAARDRRRRRRSTR